MRRLCDKEFYVFLLLLVLTAVFAGLFVLRFGVFGAKVDWISQHSVFPDYFRKQFYETGELFPEFALNIGGGQNIYHFAYYGLYSPVVLLSYFFPFIKMSDYMMLGQFSGLAASVMLLYGWLRKRGIRKKISFCAALLFLLSGPMIYHSYNQIMFVNYMPFLCMGFLGVDRYFDRQEAPPGKYRRRFGLLLSGIFLMIMTSFYFSIGGMLALALYGLHRYMDVCGQKGASVTFKKFALEAIKFAAPFLWAVMLSGVLLVPAAMALTGRKGVMPDVRGVELLLPEISLDRFFYNPYGIGLTTLGFTALIAMLLSKKISERLLAAGCIVVLTVPAFAWFLNGGLYIRDKVMIPFLPLLCYVAAYYLSRLEEGKERGPAFGCLPYLAPLAAALAEGVREDPGKYWKLVFFDGAVMLVCFFLFQKRPYGKKDALVLLLPGVIFLTLYGAVMHKEADHILDREFYSEIMGEDAEKLLEELSEKEGGFYRMEQQGTAEENAANLNRIRNMGQYISSVYASSYHQEYQEFRKNTFGAEEPFRNFLMQSALRNPVYLDLMGVKYLVSKEELAGYRLAGSSGEQKVYENEDALPIAYATDKTVGEEEYRRLAFPYNQLAFREYAVVLEGEEEGERIALQSHVERMDVKLPQEISAEKNTEYRLHISGTDQEDQESGRQRVLFLEFQVKNLRPSKDITIWMAGTRNKLTCEQHFYYNGNTKFTFVQPLAQGQTEAPMTFGKGNYRISDIQCFTGILPETEDRLCQAEFQRDREGTKGNRIAGKIEIKKPGYFITSIPFDENFEIRIDGKKTEGERVNTAFLGCRIGKGKHDIEILYHAPGVKEGKILSLAGTAIVLGVMLRRRRRKHILP